AWLDFFWCSYARSSPVVEPLTGWEDNVVSVEFFRETSGRDEKAGSEQKLIASVEIDGMTILCRRGEFQKEWPHDGNAGARHFFRRGVEIRHKAVTLFNEAAANGFLFGAVHPGFLISGTFGGVIAVNRMEGSNLDPFGQQVGLRSACETAD